jgi:hypothetical protein
MAICAPQDSSRLVQCLVYQISYKMYTLPLPCDTTVIGNKSQKLIALCDRIAAANKSNEAQEESFGIKRPIK